MKNFTLLRTEVVRAGQGWNVVAKGLLGHELVSKVLYSCSDKLEAIEALELIRSEREVSFAPSMD